MTARIPAALRSTTAIAVAAVLVSLTLIGLSYLSKTPCLGGPYDDLGVTAAQDNGHRLLCYTDVQQLWVGRGIAEGMFPYVKGEWEPGEDGGQGMVMWGSLEYPVLTGLFMWVAKQPSQNVTEYVRWTVGLMAPFVALSAVLLARLARTRVFVWAAAPALVFYAAYNWDLLPVAMCVAALYAWARGRPLVAAALFGLGTATKLYPAIFLLPMCLDRLLARDPRGALKLVAASAGAWLAVNLPFIVINAEGWVGTYLFQLGRAADITTNSIYFWGLPRLTTPQVDRLSSALMLTSWLIALTIGWTRRNEPDGYPWIAVGAGMLCGFLAFNKVYSPQYILWVLPLLVVLRVRWGWWLAYWVVDACLFVGVTRWFWEMGHDPTFTMAKQAAVIGVWGKTVVLALFVVLLPRAPLVLRPSDAPRDADDAGRVPSYIRAVTISQSGEHGADTTSRESDAGGRAAPANLVEGG